MIKEQIEQQRVRFEKWAGDSHDYRDFKRYDKNIEFWRHDDYTSGFTQCAWDGWLAAKQDLEIENAKVGDIIETPRGLFQVMKYLDSADDSGITTDDIKLEFCRYCGTGNQDHLQNCKGARG